MKAKCAKPKEEGRLYFSHVRYELVKFLTRRKSRTLELGCGEGRTGAYLLREGIASEVVGVEIDKEASTEAKKNISSVICGDLNDLRTIGPENDIMPGTFDVILCGDVLEHLVNPWATITHCASLLNDDGRMVISIPNIKHWSVLLPLIVKDRWDYMDTGILDRTHLRFFTKKTFSELADGGGLNVEICSTIIWGRKFKLLNSLTMHLFESFLAQQWIFVLKK